MIALVIASLAISLVIALIKLYGTYIGACGLIHYYTEIKGLPYPSDDELEQCINWAAKHWVNDLFKTKL